MYVPISAAWVTRYCVEEIKKTEKHGNLRSASFPPMWHVWWEMPRTPPITGPTKRGLLKNPWILRSCTWLAAEQLVHCNLISSCHPGLIKVRTPMIRMRLGSGHTGWSFLEEFTRWRNLKWKKHNHITIENGGLSMCFLLECWYMDSMQVKLERGFHYAMLPGYLMKLTWGFL